MSIAWPFAERSEKQMIAVTFFGFLDRIVTAIGVVCVLWLLKNAIQQLSRITPYRKYCGNYESFHLSTTGGIYVIRSCLSMNVDIFLRLRVTMQSEQYEYSGRCSLLRGNVFLSLKGANHPEVLTIMLHRPLNDFDVLVGVYTGTNEATLPVCGKMLLQKVAEQHPTGALRPTDCHQNIARFLQQPGNPIKVQALRASYLQEVVEESRQ